MGLLQILNRVAHKQLDGKTVQPQVVKTPTPLGMHQGSVVILPEIDLALAQADGSIIGAVSGNQTVRAVGTLELFGMQIYNCYLNDAGAFVQLVVNKNDTARVLEAKLWTFYREVLPQTSDEWGFWLGTYQRDNQGEFIRDSSGVALRAEWGLIGWPQFQVDGTPNIVYNRSWYAGTDGCDPVSFTESITDMQGNTTRIRHEAMEYARQLTSAQDSTVESLFVSMVQEDNTASINVFIGIPLDAQGLKVLVS